MPTTTRQIAELAHLSEQSVRNYTRWYGELLSPSARGESGPRLFDDDDVRTLCTIAEMRREGVPQAEIIERLRRGDIYIDVVAHNTPQQETPQGQKAGQDATLVLPEVQSIVLHRFDAIERRLEANDRQRDLWLIGTGIWIGILIMGAIFYVVWLGSYGV